jgi:hypothetical protein
VFAEWARELVCTEPATGMTTTVVFVDLGNDHTEVRIHQADVPEMFRSPEARVGFASSLDRLAAYIASL